MSNIWTGPRPRRTPGQATRRSLILALLAATVLGLLDAPAEAGTYEVSYCRTPSGGPAPMSDWQEDEGQFRSIVYVRDDCPAGPFHVVMDPIRTHPAHHFVAAVLHAPDGTAISGYRLWRSVQLAAPYGYRLRELTDFGPQDLDICRAPACTSMGSSSDPFGKANLLELRNRRNVRGLSLLLTCELEDSSTESCPTTEPGAHLRLHRAELTLLDESAPVIATLPTSPLVSPGAPLAGAAPVTIAATDRGGGVYQALFEVDGAIRQAVPIDLNGGKCVPPFSSVQPCKPSATATVALDTTGLADGLHSLRILVSDATETNLTAWGPVTIQTANGRCNPGPPSHIMEMRVGLVGRRGAKATRITTKLGRPLRARGRLLGADGSPIANAKVCVAERWATGGAVRKRATVSTDAKGVRLELPPGPSRRVYFVHRVPEGAVVSSIAVRVRAPVGLRGSQRFLRNGQTLTMRGRLLSRPFPKRGALVELQAHRATGWQTFGTAKTNRRGRFVFKYTFSRTLGVQRYLLRARVPKQPGYPFESGASRPLPVTVAG